MTILEISNILHRITIRLGEAIIKGKAPDFNNLISFVSLCLVQEKAAGCFREKGSMSKPWECSMTCKSLWWQV